jgi:tRNA (mo5U34)-methyltransferase
MPMPRPADTLDIVALHAQVPAFQKRLAEIKRGLPNISFYPHDTFGNLWHLEKLLHGERRDLARLAGGLPVADIGAADGDLAFFLEAQGLSMHIIDNAPTNCNGLAGARAVKEALGSSVAVHDIDLDSQFTLPQAEYGLVFFLGILYHLKNPYYALEMLARRSRHIALSTRVAQFARPLTPPPAGSVVRELLSRITDSPSEMTRIAGLPVAYLVDERECNDDPTNFWIFTHEGLKRLLSRCGWDVLDYMAVGNTTRSDPATADGDERAFCLARSRVFGRA